MNPSLRSLGVFSLIMINVVAVDSLRILPFAALLGFSLVFYYLIASLAFLAPVALVSSELATTWPSKGGIYIWVNQAFGPKWGMMVVWMQWLYNLFWYPTILLFIVSTVFYAFYPQTAVLNNWLLFAFVLGIFWLTTWANLYGMKLSSRISALGAIVGVLLPMGFISLLSLYWLIQGNHPLQIHMSAATFFPHIHHMSDLSPFSMILFGMVGIEISAIHAESVKRPHYTYPRAIFYSSLVIFLSLTCSSLGIALVVPASKLSVTSGVIQAFEVILQAYHLSWLNSVVVGMILVGTLGCVSTWVIGPAKSLSVAAKAYPALPRFFSEVNHYGVPANMLWGQALIFSILSFFFIISPHVKAVYWVFSIISAQLALLVYPLLFFAAIYLRYRYPNIKRPYSIPGEKLGLKFVAFLGIFSSIVGFFIGFIPPENLHMTSTYSWALYDFLLLICIVFVIIIPFLFMAKRLKS